MQNEYDVVVVGGGPSGSMAARFAAEKGVSVLLLEKDRDIGYPVRCAEATGKAGLEEFIQPDERWISSHIDKFGFISPNGNEVTLDFPSEGYILERKIFDYELARTAAKAGAAIQTRVYVNGLLYNNGSIAGVKIDYRGEQKGIKAKIVIAADGVESRVGRWAGLKTHIDFRNMECCAQVTAYNINNIDASTCYFYFGNEIAPEGYLWIFPKGNKMANIGLGISGSVGKKRSAISYLNSFMSMHYPGASVLTQIAGGVPCDITLEKISAPGIMLAGDAARQVNPLTGGGIVSGMIGGSIAGRIAAEAIKTKKLDHILTYDKVWHERLGKRHEIFNKIKNGIYYLTDEKFNKLSQSLNKIPYNKRTLGKFFLTALMDQPSLLVDVAKVFIV
jgi:digeranylgeranylglycerophospholipid reductase